MWIKRQPGCKKPHTATYSESTVLSFKILDKFKII